MREDDERIERFRIGEGVCIGACAAFSPALEIAPEIKNKVKAALVSGVDEAGDRAPIKETADGVNEYANRGAPYLQASVRKPNRFWASSSLNPTILKIFFWSTGSWIRREPEASS